MPNQIAVKEKFIKWYSEQTGVLGVETMANWWLAEIASEKQRLVEEIKKFECECTCGYNFKPGSGCLCFGDRDGFNTAKIRIITLIQHHE